jgi:flavin-dependent dehydrogenase
MAARTLGRAGVKAALLERKKDIPKIHRSCGGVLNLNEPTFDQIVNFDEDRHLITCETLGFTIGYDGPYQDVYGFCLYSPGGRRLEFGNFAELRKDPKKNRVGASLSKEQLLRILLQETEQSGVAVFPNSNVVAVGCQQDGAVVACDDGQTFTGRFVIAADGINSRTARVTGMNRARDFYGTSRDTSYCIRGTACPDPDGFLFMITPRSIFSMIPVAEKNCYHIYASTTKRGENIPALLRYFVHEDPTFSPWYKNSEILEHRTACVVSLMSPMELPFKDNILFVGDSCWRREMSNVGALCSAYKAATVMAGALAAGKTDAEGLREYFDWYTEHYFGPFGRRKQSSRDFIKYLTPDDLDYLAGLPQERFPQTLDIFKVVKWMGSTYADFMTQIYDERPDTMERMMELRNNMDDDFQLQIKAGFKIV